MGRPVRLQNSPPSSTTPLEGNQVNEPALIIADDQVHAVWSAGQNGAIWSSRASVANSLSAEGWSTPQQLPAPSPAGCCPAIVADAQNHLHVAYTISVNEQRGVYYTRSEDDGAQWAAASLIFDAAASRWSMVTNPSIAVDAAGGIHVVWVRGDGSATHSQPTALYYAYSADGGTQWSEAFRVAEGSYNWPLLEIDEEGRAHVLWNEVTGRGEWWHRWLDPTTQTWSSPSGIPNFAAVQPPGDLVSDGANRLYLLGISQDSPGLFALRMATWNGTLWTTEQPYLLGHSVAPGMAAALHAPSGTLYAAYRGVVTSEEGGTEINLWTTSRMVDAVLPMPARSITRAIPDSYSRTHCRTYARCYRHSHRSGCCHP